MNGVEEEIARLVRSDPAHPGTVEVERLIESGARMRRRRAVLLTSAVGLAAAVIIAPMLLLVGHPWPDGAAPSDTGRASGSPSEPRAPSPTTATKATRPRVACGVQVCALPGEDDPGIAEHGTVIGSYLDMGRFEGSQEVVYAVRTKGYDTSKGKPADHPVAVISTGIVVDGALRRSVWGFQPNEDPPSASPLHVYGGSRTLGPDGAPHYGVFGYLEGEHPEITVTGGAAGAREVSGVSTTVLPGYTVFYDTGAWEESWSATADLTYAVPDGPTCELTTCGTNG